MATDSLSTKAWGIALSTVGADGCVLDAWYPSPRLGEAPSEIATHPLHAQLAAAGRDDEVRGTTQEVVTRAITLADAPVDAADAYLRLHLVAAGRTPTVISLDRFPRMVDSVLPTGVRIGDADRVRLGAHLAEGTTVMHEGFVNFNAGTLGASMIEGRISQGVVVGDGSDVGGGASTMGTLSGGGTERVSIGRRSLVGAEAGVGIALGDDCVVEAGLYVTAGTKVEL